MLGLREQTGARLATVHQRHLVATRQRHLGQVPAEELGTTEDEQFHELTLALGRWLVERGLWNA